VTLASGKLSGSKTTYYKQCDGKNTVIVFPRGMQNMLKEVLKKRDYTEDALILL